MTQIATDNEIRDTETAKNKSECCGLWEQFRLFEERASLVFSVE